VWASADSNIIRDVERLIFLIVLTHAISYFNHAITH